MDILTGLLLGIIQGLTEFLPISSSGHLILAREVLGFQSSHDLAFDAVLQLATALAVLVYFRHDFIRLASTFFRLMGGSKREVGEQEKTLFVALIVGTIPAVVFGLLLEDIMETLFRNSLLVAATLAFGGIIMFFAERYAVQNKNLTIRTGLLIGFFQSLALIPGMSRSGMTISGGLFLGLSRENAARFSFLLAFPIIFGSGMKKLFELGGSPAFAEISTPLFFGMLAAFVTGMFAIHFLLRFLRSHTMYVFVFYRIVLAVTIVVLVV